MQAYSVPCWWVGWWLWGAGCISQDTYLLYHVVGVKTKMICHDTQPDFLCSVVQTWTSAGWWPLGTWATVRLLPQRSDFWWFLHFWQWYSLWWRRWYNCTINVKGRQSRLSNSGGDKGSCCCCLGQGWPCFVEFKYVRGRIKLLNHFWESREFPPPCNTLIIWGWNCNHYDTPPKNDFQETLHSWFWILNCLSNLQRWNSLCTPSRIMVYHNHLLDHPYVIL